MEHTAGTRAQQPPPGRMPSLLANSGQVVPPVAPSARKILKGYVTVQIVKRSELRVQDPAHTLNHRAQRWLAEQRAAAVAEL